MTSETQNTAPERIWLRWEPGKAVTNGPLTQNPDYTSWVREDLHERLVAEAVAAALEETAKLVEDDDGDSHPGDIADDIRALIADPSILAKRDAQMKAEGLREAAGLIKPPKFCLPDQVGRVEAMHEMRHAILARAEEIEKGEG
jgi:hypothetical protein